MSRFFKGDVSSSSGSESESSSDEDVVPSSAAGRTGTTTSAPPPKKTTGGFFRQLAESSSDDSEDDSDSDQSSDADSSDSDATHAGQDAPAKQPNRFIKGAASDSSDSDTDNEGFGKKRKVESGQAKRAKELKGLADEVAEAVSRGNAASVQAGFDKLVKFAGKNPALFAKGFPEDGTAILTDVQSYLKDSPNSVLKQKIRKFMNQHTSEVSVVQQNKGPEEEEEDPFSKSLNDILRGRGKKTVDTRKQQDALAELLADCKDDVQQVRVILAIIPMHFDATAGNATAAMKVPTWQTAREDVHKLLSVLNNGRSIRVSAFASEVQTKDGVTTIPGNIVSYVERLDDEFLKSLQALDAHTSEYAQRLKDETALYTLIVQSANYFRSVADVESECAAVMRRIEHIYFKNDLVNARIESAVQQALGSDLEAKPAAELIQELCSYIYRSANSEGTKSSRQKMRALLCHVYHHALHDRYDTSRRMLLMGRLQDAAPKSDIPTQILYNRALAQFAMSAFRTGHYEDAKTSLLELLGSGRSRELLAQGTGRFQDKAQEQIKLAMQRALPYHMHIDLDLLETVYMLSCIITDTPALASANWIIDQDRKKKRGPVCPFRRCLDHSDRFMFIDATKQNIVTAAKQLAEGRWMLSFTSLSSLSFWDILGKKVDIKRKYLSALRRTSLMAFVGAHGLRYKCLALPWLEKKFMLPGSQVQAILSSMIAKGQLKGYFVEDATRGTALSFDQEYVTALQALASKLSDRLLAFDETNQAAFNQASTGRVR